MCDKKIFPPWPGHNEACNGISHSFKDIAGRIEVQPDGNFRALCPDYIWPAGGGNTPASWDRNNDIDALKNRELVNKYFIIKPDQTFESYHAPYNSHETQVAAIKKFVRNEAMKRLVIKGDVGLGKSHLAQACVNAMRPYGIMISSSSLYRLYREMESFDQDEIAEKAIGRFDHARLVVVDDLGVEKHTDTQVFNQGFKDFLESFTGKLIVTTNLDEHDMGNIYGQKIVSRVYEQALVIVLKGKDYRMGA